MQSTGRRDRRRVRHLRRLGGQGAHRKGLRRPAARARQEHRAHQGLRERHEGALGIPPSRRTHEGDGRALPGAQARLPAQREEPRLLGERQGVAIHRGQALRLVSRLSRRRHDRSCGVAQSYRWSDLDFEANAKEGIAIDWPIRYADIAPWYDHVEKHAGIAGSHEGMPQLPDGQFQPAMPLNCGEELVAGKLNEAVRRQASHHSRPHRERHPAAPGPQRRASIATPAGSAVRTARTSARSRPRFPPR